MRVNARFDESYAKRMEYLTRATNMSVSEVIKSSVQFYYESVIAQRSPELKHLSRFIGALSSGRSDIASNYKCELVDSLSAKHAKHGKRLEQVEQAPSRHKTAKK